MQPIDLNELATHIIRYGAGMNAATYKWLMMVAEFDNRSTWPNGEFQSCAQWLQRKWGLKLGAARERLRVAHALQDLPKISAAMARGALTFSKVRAGTRIGNRATEEQLLTILLQRTAEDVEIAVRDLRHGREPKQLQNAQPDVPPLLSDQQLSTRSVTHNWQSDGFLVLKVRLPAPSGKRLLHALDTAATKASPAGTFTARRADALMALADSFLEPENHLESRDALIGVVSEGDQPPNSALVPATKQHRS